MKDDRNITAKILIIRLAMLTRMGNVTKFKTNAYNHFNDNITVMRRNDDFLSLAWLTSRPF